MGRNNIVIVTDSTADIPETYTQSLPIHQIPNILVIGENTYEDGKGMSREEFYHRLPYMNPLPTTATPSIERFHQTYESLFSKGANQIISIHAASQLSGIFSAASIAAKEFSGRVQVFDSQFLTLGLGFQCLEAAEIAAEGAPLEIVVQTLIEARRRARVIAMLDTLEYVRRSGRVSWAKAKLGSLLRLKPFVEVRDGKINSLGETRTRRKGIERLIELIHRCAPLKRLAILHTNALEEAQMILNELGMNLPKPAMIVNITTIIGAHVGPNGLGMAALQA
jgi:DegV family protein with EDD domain